MRKGNGMAKEGLKFDLEPKTAAPQFDLVREKCKVEKLKDGGFGVTFYVDPDAAIRLTRRAGTQPVSKYMFENILYRAVLAEVY